MPARMEPAASIIHRLGGPTNVARALGLHRTRVSAWQRSREQGGTGGQIPHWHHEALLRLAVKLKVQLAPREFVLARRPRQRTAARASAA